MKVVRAIKNSIKFSIESFSLEDFDNDEFFIADVAFLSTRQNSYKLDISEEVLRNCAGSLLGKWIVVHMNPYAMDAGDHDPKEQIVGNFPINQSITFSEQDGYLVASAVAVISKVYASDFYEIFSEQDDMRKVSVEMLLDSTPNVDGGETVERFNITGVTVLGKKVKPSCSDAQMNVVRFSVDKATEFYESIPKKTKFDEFEEFVNKRRNAMDNKTYKVNKTELKTSPWGDVDKTTMRNKIMDADNKGTLVHDVYATVEDGWEDAPSEKLKYPIMQLVGDTFYYNRYGLKSALGYAKAEQDSSVVDKVEKLYKKFKIEEEDESQMSEKKKFEIEGREAWGDIIKAVEKHEGEGVYVDSVEKDHLIFTKDKVRYWVDADVEVGKDDKSVSAKIKWDTVKKDADQKMSEGETIMSDDEAEMSDVEKELCGMSDDDIETMSCDLKGKMSSDANVDPGAYSKMLAIEAEKNKRLNAKLAEKENIIMENETELSDLKKFKCDIEDKAKCSEVDATMAEVKEMFSDEEFEALKEEGMKCECSNLDGWKNKVKASVYDKGGVKCSEGKETLWSMSASEEILNKQSGLWN